MTYRTLIAFKYFPDIFKFHSIFKGLGSNSPLIREICLDRLGDESSDIFTPKMMHADSRITNKGICKVIFCSHVSRIVAVKLSQPRT